MSQERKSPRINLGTIRDTVRRVLKSPRRDRSSPAALPTDANATQQQQQHQQQEQDIDAAEYAVPSRVTLSDPVVSKQQHSDEDFVKSDSEKKSEVAASAPRKSPRRKKSVRGKRSMRRGSAPSKEKDSIAIECLGEHQRVTADPHVQRICASLVCARKCKPDGVRQSLQTMADVGARLQRRLRDTQRNVVLVECGQLAADVSDSMLRLRHVVTHSRNPFTQRGLTSVGAQLARAAVAYIEEQQQQEQREKQPTEALREAHKHLLLTVDEYVASVLTVRSQQVESTELQLLSSDLKSKGDAPGVASRPNAAVLELCVEATQSSGARVLQFAGGAAQVEHLDWKLFGQSLKELKSNCDALASHMQTEALASTLQWRGAEAIDAGVAVIRARLDAGQQQQISSLLIVCGAEVTKLLEYVAAHVEIRPVMASSPVETPVGSLAADSAVVPPLPVAAIGAAKEDPRKLKEEQQQQKKVDGEDQAAIDMLSPRSRLRARTVMDSLQKKARLIRKMNRHSMEIGALLVDKLHLQAPSAGKILGVSVEGLLCDRGMKVPRFFFNIVQWLLQHDLGDGSHDAAPEETTALVDKMESGQSIPDGTPSKVVLSVLRTYFERSPQVLCVSEEEALEELGNCPDKRYRIIGYHCVFYRLPALRRQVLFFLLNKYALPLCRRGSLTIENFCDSWASLLLWGSESASSCLYFLMTNLELIRNPSKTMAGATWTWLSGRHVLQCASFQTIIEMLLHSSYNESDTNFCEIVLMTHTMFCRSKDLLESLLNEYDKHRIGAADSTVEWKEKRRHKVLAVLGFWFMRPNYLLPDQVTRDFVSTWQDYVTRLIRMKNLTSHEKASFKKYTKVLSGQYTILEKSAEERLQLLRNSFSANSISFPNLISMEPIVVAGTITNVDRYLFKLIPPYELFGKNHTIPEKSPSFTRMIAQFNRVSLWTAFEIVNRPSRSERVDMLNFMITVCFVLFELKNFHACYAMICGMNYASVSRLAKTWKKIPKTAMKQYEELMLLFDMSRNHRNYRSHLKLVSAPLIPHIGLVSRDLFSISENNKDVVDGLINVEKLRMLEKTVSELLKMQDVPFVGLSVDPNLQNFFRVLPEIDEKMIYEKSLQCEPRAAE